jgi:hypothetical protein
MVLRKKSAARLLFQFLVVFSLFQKNSSFDRLLENAEKSKEKSAENDKFNRIRCPLCRWRPRASSRWYCADVFVPPFFHLGCGTAWNTFDTRGRCPGCGYQWRFTDCLRCGGRSPHEDWYESSSEAGGTNRS